MSKDICLKRLGYHLPPALEEGKPAPKISDMVKNEPAWTLTNYVAPAVTDFSYSAERTTQEGQPNSSTSAFQVAAWDMYMGGWLPNTNFFYFAEFDIVSGGFTNPDHKRLFRLQRRKREKQLVRGWWAGAFASRFRHPCGSSVQPSPQLSVAL